MQLSFTKQDKIKLLNLQLLIARAAQKDSLNWWEDDSLTSAGAFVLERLFLHAPSEAGLKLALQAAKSRYNAAFKGTQAAVHLFRLDAQNETGSILKEIPASHVAIPNDPIPSMEALRKLLLQEIGAEPKYEIVATRGDQRLEIRAHKPITEIGGFELAQTLAWATLEGEPESPVFPFIINQS